MSKGEDLRVKKTRAALIDAFFALVEEKAIEDITVNELCDRAMVRRATFYKHYRDKNDFLVAIIKHLRLEFDMSFSEINKLPLTKEYYRAYAEALVNYLTDHLSLVENILNSELHGTFVNMLLTQNFLDTKERLEAGVKNGLPLKVSTDTATCMLTGGLGMTIILWFEGGCKQSKEWLIKEISASIDLIL